MGNGYAQLSNLVFKKITTTGTTILDKKSIIPSSIILKNIDSSFYAIDYINATITWIKKPLEDSVVLQYRSFVSKLNSVAKRFNYDSIRNNFIAAKPYTFISKNTATADDGLFNFGNINYNGSFGRSLSFGNNQDAVFNSQLNLQLNGFIGDSIQISAAITDNNIPIQPDGTTAQLNEFDRILLQFKKRNWELNLGDIDIRQNNLYFLNFYKRLQGASYSLNSKLNNNTTNRLLVSAAIAKGKFTRNIFNGLEGNQGPYRLQGVNGELFFIILANTERVYIDGELLQRGEDQDYTINYNTAEISFTPKRMITKDRRIQVEFEYTDRNYLNALFFLGNEFQLNKKLKINIGLYSNGDAKNSPINQILDNKQKQFLANIGDSVQNAFYPVFATDTFSLAKVLYKRVKLNSSNDSIYVYSTNKDSAKFVLNFADVGANKGNYIPFLNGVNGKVYQYIAPINNIPQGNFEPAFFLVAPKKQQLFSMGLAYQINPKTNLLVDLALSSVDVNTYSSKDKNNNVGSAAKFLVTNTRSIFLGSKMLELNTTAGYEYANANFRPLERLRTIEFVRDWGLPLMNNNFVAEQLPTASIELKDAKQNSFLYQTTSYIRSDGYKGFRQQIKHHQTIHGWQLNSLFFLTNSASNTTNGFFLRPTIDLSKTLQKLKNYTVGINYSLEHNEQKFIGQDSVTPISYAFDVLTAYIKSNQQLNNKWGFTYFTRSDKLPYLQQLLQVDRSHNYNAQLELLQNKKHQLRFNITYRQLQVFNKNISNLQSDNSLLGRTEYVINEWNGFLTGNALYELGAGQEQQRDISYIEVPVGRGEFQWRDYNNDGVQQLNEFEVALFPDQAKFIRLFTPTNRFIKANYTQFNYSVLLSPKALFSSVDNKKIKQFITRFNLQSALQTAKKELSKGNPTFNPFGGKIADTALINLNYILNNTLSFNRFSSVWGVDVNNITNYAKSLLTYGFESRQLNEWSIKARATIKRTFTLELTQKIGSNSLFTPSFSNRNFALQTIQTEPKVSYILGNVFRLQTSYIFNQKENAMQYGGEKSVSNAIIVEAKYNAIQKGSLSTRFTYNNISFTGTNNTTISYIMLDALLPGKNLLWNIEFTKRLINNLEINISYEGRKPGNTRVINTGRASIRALL